MSRISKQATNQSNIEVLITKMDYVQQDVTEIKRKLDADYVTQDQFEPIKKLVYGMVGLILTSVAIALISLVVRQ